MSKNEEATLTEVVKALCLVAAALVDVACAVRNTPDPELGRIELDADEFFAGIFTDE